MIRWIPRIFFFIFLTVSLSWADLPSAPASAPSLAAILEGLQNRYTGPGFSADFNQAATLKALNIKDTAAGHAVFKQPGKMRWVYTSPEPQVIITNGVTVWIHRPEDNQVMIGSAVDYFGDGSGGSFLADIGNLQTIFDIVLEYTDEMGHHLTLYPRKENAMIREVRLVVHKTRFDIITIQTVNPYGDVTEINFVNLNFHPDLNETQFEFTVPPGAQLLKMEN